MKIAYLIFVASFLSNPSFAASPEEEVAIYIKIFEGNISEHSTAADALAWKGLSDTRLFDIIEQRALTDYIIADQNKHERERVAQYVRALSYSGNQKYRPTIQIFVANASYHRAGREARENLFLYGKWNPILSNRATFDPKYTDDVNRIMNLLRSDSLYLHRVAAKTIFSGMHEKALLNSLAQSIKEYELKKDAATEHFNATLETTEGNTSDFLDTLAWMKKAMDGATEEARKAPLITNVRAKNERVQS